MQVQQNNALSSTNDKAFTPTNVVVVGVGGGGGNAVNRMINSGITNNITYITVNTDLQDLRMSKAKTRIQIGDKLTKGQGAGAKPDIGRKSAEESIKAIEACLSSADMVFITAGMGGGTGTGAAPVIAKVAKELGKLTVAVVTKPFSFEQRQRMLYAEQGIAELKKVADAIVVIPNDKVLKLAPNIKIEEAFCKVDEVLQMGISGIADLITRPQMINLDFADVREVMASSGLAHLAIGFGKGGDKDSRIKDAIYNAVNSPLLETSINGATKVIVNIIGSPDMTLIEISDAANIIGDIIDPGALVVVGLDVRGINTDEVWVTLIATGFKDSEVVGQQQAQTTGQQTQSFSRQTTGANGFEYGQQNTRTMQPSGTMNLSGIVSTNTSNLGVIREQQQVANNNQNTAMQGYQAVAHSQHNISNSSVPNAHQVVGNSNGMGFANAVQHNAYHQPTTQQVQQQPNMQQNTMQPVQQAQYNNGFSNTQFAQPQQGTLQYNQQGQQVGGMYGNQSTRQIGQVPNMGYNVGNGQQSGIAMQNSQMVQSRVGTTRIEADKPNVPAFLQKIKN